MLVWYVPLNSLMAVLRNATIMWGILPQRTCHFTKTALTLRVQMWWSMNLYVPLGSSPAIGRRRPYKIGGPADAEEAWSMYTCSAHLL